MEGMDCFLTADLLINVNSTTEKDLDVPTGTHFTRPSMHIQK